jgi:hypothetical protein
MPDKKGEMQWDRDMDMPNGLEEMMLAGWNNIGTRDHKLWYSD